MASMWLHTRTTALSAMGRPGPPLRGAVGAAHRLTPVGQEPLRLAIELIPRQTWGRNLRTALGKSAWSRLSKQVREAAGNRCEACGSTVRLQCDEQWAYDDAAHVQRLTRLRCLCQMCHHVVNFNRTRMVAREQADRYPNLVEDVIAHFMRVNGIDRQTFDRHHAEASARWATRSAAGDWTLDYGDYAATVSEAGR